MSEVLKNIELIERYCEGKLTTGEKVDFEHRLLVDAEFKDEFELYKVIVSGIREHGEDNLKARLKVADLELDSKPVASLEDRIGVKSNYIYWAVAASIVLIVSVGLFWKFSSNSYLPELANTYYEKDKGLPVEMSTSRNQLDEAMNSYKANDYIKAKTQIELMLRHNLGNDTLKYYYGVVNYELGDYSSSNATLKEIKPESQFFDKAQYRLILIELKNSNKKNAIERIDICLENKSYLYYDKLVRLKEDLTK